MFTSMKLTATFVLLVAAVQLSHQQPPDGHAKRELQVEKVVKAFKAHEDSTTGLRSKRDTDADLRNLIRSLLRECFADPNEPEPVVALPEGPCSSPDTVNLSGDWRLDNQGSNLQPIDNYYNCDAYLFDNQHWFRITGDGGNRIRDTCSPAYSCGSHGGIWTNAAMPTEVGEVRQVALYGSWSGDCSWYPFSVDTPLTVQRCTSSGDFVYKIDGLTGCYHSVCGMY